MVESNFAFVPPPHPEDKKPHVICTQSHPSQSKILGDALWITIKDSQQLLSHIETKFLF